jgi:hypothetical protein
MGDTPSLLMAATQTHRRCIPALLMFSPINWTTNLYIFVYSSWKPKCLRYVRYSVITNMRSDFNKKKGECSGYWSNLLSLNSASVLSAVVPDTSTNFINDENWSYNDTFSPWVNLNLLWKNYWWSILKEMLFFKELERYVYGHCIEITACL